jgi:uncharacterized membrane protein
MPARKTYLIFFILLFYFFLFSSISLVNHYNFRTYAYDLGINNNAIYDYAHFRWNDCMLMQPQFKNILSDHFSLIPIFVSPLYWIFGSYTMLIVQIIAILFGGVGIYMFVSSRSKNKHLPILAIVHFFSIWGIYSALSFDYHDNVVGAMFVPWFIYFFDQKKWKKAIVFFFLILISKENIALWAAFIAMGLIFLNLRDKEKLKYAAILASIATIYFITVIKIIMPSIGNDGREYLHFNYSALGSNFSEAIITIFTKPFLIFKLLFINPLSDSSCDGIKSELHKMVLLSGGFVLLWRPQFILMLIPIYAQKMFNDDFQKWGINLHYSIEFVPILTIALFGWIAQMPSKTFQVIISTAILLITAYSTFNKLQKRNSKWYSPEASQFYKMSHYKRDFSVPKIYAALNLIPPKASLSAQSPLVPHLSFRDYIYQYPDIFNSNYIVLMENEDTYPLNKVEYDKKKSDLIASDWDIIYKEYPLIIFKKKEY